MYFYRPQRSWGMVIFSEACVKNSVRGGGACMAGGLRDRGGCAAGADMHGRRACMVVGHVWWGCMAGGCAWQGCVCGRGHAWQGVCMAGKGACIAGGVHGRGACIAGGVHGRGHVWQGGMHSGGGGHVWQILRDTVNEQAVHILLECILVYHCISFAHHYSMPVSKTQAIKQVHQARKELEGKTCS